jgi:hypothetical protein
MCRYRKSLFLCNHSQLSQEPFIICAAQQDHLSRTAAEPCGTIETHGCGTIRVSHLCGYCAAKRITVDRRFENVKVKMADLRRHLDEVYGDCMKHLDEAGLEFGTQPGDMEGGGNSRTGGGEEERKQSEDPVQEFLSRKMNEKYSHLMMLSST